MDLNPDDLIRILLAIAVGGAIGLEREFRDKAAGFRTLIFICVGATLFTIFSAKLAASDQDATRIASNIVSGVGFLGAGVILRNGGRVVGLTTAATIWLVAALGMGLGGGHYAFVLAVTGLTLIVLWTFPRVERWVDHLNEERTYQVVCALNADKYESLERLFRESKLRAVSQSRNKSGQRLTCSWKAHGALRHHEQFVQKLLADPEIEELKF